MATPTPTPTPAPDNDIGQLVAAAWVAYLKTVTDLTAAIVSPKDTEGATVSPASGAIRNADDDSVNTCRPCVLVAHNPATQPFGSGVPVYMVPVLLQAFTDRNDDKSRAVLNKLYANLEVAALAIVNKESVLTATDVTFGGFVIADTSTDAPDGSHGKSLTITCHFKAT